MPVRPQCIAFDSLDKGLLYGIEDARAIEPAIFQHSFANRH